MASKSLPESLRCRQAQLYYESWQRVQEHLHADPDNLQANAFTVTKPDHVPKSSQDRALTAFAQLAALRLSCKRAFITIVGWDVEYILAEATQSLSLAQDTTHMHGDQISIGRQVLEKEKGFGHLVLDAKYKPSDFPEDAEPVNALVIHDCLEDEKVRDSPLVRKYAVRFVVGVPIRTPTGICIGTLTAIANEPGVNGSVSSQKLEFLQDTADTIFQHLLLSKGHIDSLQGADMVDQLSTFITQSGLRGQKTPSRHSSASDGSLKKIQSSHKPSSVSDFDVRTTFARAAAYLRTATAADGCIFLDAGSAISGAHGRKHPDSFNAKPQEDTDESVSASESTHTSATSEISDDAGAKQKAQQNTAAIIAGDIDRGSGQGGSTASSFTLLASEIQHLITTYPQGKVFTFHDNHYIPTSSDPESSDTATTPSNGIGRPRNLHKEGRATRASIAETMISTIPNVTTAVFLPLWDFGQERWHSCTILWTTQIGRMICTVKGMPYLKAFADSIMSEVSRVDALRQDRAKTTFIASISHELRSPLHGILGGLEFFHDTELDSSQRNLLTSIESCGKTLMDTIDHVLDFAKINSKGAFRGKRARAARGTQRSRQRTSNTAKALKGESTFDLAILVEDVVEAVAAGQTFRRQKDPRTSDTESTMSPSTPMTSKGSFSPWSDGPATSTSESTVALVLDVARSQDWKVRSFPGAIRRIVMNLFGNAMKYTTQGEIQVLLRPKRAAMPKSGRTTIEIVIKDTGRGLTTRYLRENLYKPFAQEDSFSSGMGLGLNIVKQLVEFLSGKIEISSELGTGTEVTVTLTLPLADEIAGEDSSELLSLAAAPWSGHSCSLLDLGASEPAKQHPATLVQRSMRDLLANTFSLSISEREGVPAQATDLFVLIQPPSALDALSAKLAHIMSGTNKHVRRPAVLILCADQFEARRVENYCISPLAKQGAIIQVITQPLAPKKVAAALKRCAEAVQRGSTDPYMNGAAKLSSVKVFAETAEPNRYEKEPPAGSQPAPVPQIAALELTSPIGQSEPPAYPATIGVGRKQEQFLAVRTASEPQLNSDPFVDKQSNPPRPLVLLVDDNDVNLKLLVMLMEKNKTRHVSAVNGLEALDKYKSHAESGDPINLILMDISMPIMDGIESTELIRAYEQERKASKATIFALSGLSSEQAQAKAKSVGFDDYIRKPANMKVLRKLVEDWKHTDLDEVSHTTNGR